MLSCPTWAFLLISKFAASILSRPVKKLPACFKMPTCFICSKVTVDVSGLFRHFSYFHNNHTFSIYRCIEDGCRRTFHLKNTFRKHISIQHGSRSSCSSSNLVSDVASTSHPSKKFPVQPSCSSEVTLIKSVESSNSLTLLLASLHANPLLPKNAVQCVVDGMRNYMCEELSNNIGNIFDEMVTSVQNDSDITVFKDKFLSAVQSPLDSFKTEHLRLKHFLTEGSYVPPKEITIGQRMSTIRRGGVVNVKPTVCTEQFIPLRLTLQKFFSLNNIMSETLHYINSLSTGQRKGVLENFIQGTFWSTRIKNNEGKLVFPLFMFFDDYESGNVLGSHSGIHKLGAVYVSVGCIPPHRASSLSNIFLTLLFHSSDRVSFGNAVIFHPIIEEFNFLSENGIQIDTADFKGTLYFELALILGDNLGIHSITGFNESFSSNFPCRICTIPKEELKKQCYENVNLLRNSAQYDRQLAECNSSNTGIKEKCVWLDVKGFNLFEQVGVDVMHDILEGVAKYIMCFVTWKYVSILKYFSIQVLNDKISCFDYGPDSSSKPCLLNIDHISKGNMRLSASEMLTFVRYFGLLIGEYVPFDEQHWILYTTLRKIIDLVMCQKVTCHTGDLLKCLVGELNEMYLALTNEYLKPKFHFLTHYPSFMIKYGPIVNFWSMRYEAKHRLSKIAARASFNRRNITLTLANKHQMQLNEVFLKGHLNNIISVGPDRNMSIEMHTDIITALNLSADEPLRRIAWVKVKGTEYKSHTILTEDIDDLGGATFMVIRNIYMYSEERVIFECAMFNTLEFDDHFNSFEVAVPDNVKKKIIFYDSLACHVPNNITILSSGQKFITLRSQL